METKIHIDIVSDVVCPWCVIGYKRLQKAIDELGLKDKVEIEWLPYQLNAYMPPEGEELHDHIAKKYGMTREESKQWVTSMVPLGDEVGFSLDFFEGMKTVNTLDAHILLEFAKKHHQQTEFKMNLFKAFFSEQQDVSDREILLTTLEKIGLDRNLALNKLENESARAEVQSQEKALRNQGVSAVPTMFFNGRIKQVGAQSIAEYKALLQEIINRE